MPADVAEHIIAHKTAAASNRPRRSFSLDALRGLAVLGMVLSGMVPYWNHTLPAWMYHAQLPPPSHLYDAALTGLTWVDLVFPLFLFALGAAVPLALGPQLDSGKSRWSLSWAILWRGVLLLFFALYEQHLSPGLLKDNYGWAGWLMGPLFFLMLFPIFMRLPRRWPVEGRFAIRLSGWILAVIALFLVDHADGSNFTVHRHDIIIVILANVAVSTALLWLWFKGRVAGRVIIIALVVAMLLARNHTGWGVAVTDLAFLKPLLGERIYNGLIWACHPVYQQYLIVTLAGTFAGDILATWLRPSAQRLSFSIQNSRWRELSTLRCMCLLVVCLALVASTLTGLYLHDTPLTAMIAVAMAALGFLILYSPPARKPMRTNPVLRGQPRVSALLFRALFTWGMVWLMIGLALLPYQGGIRKDPATFSYLFVCAGLAHAVLIIMAVITDAFHRPGLVFLLIDNGQNPLIAYVAGGMVLMPILHLVPVGEASLIDWLSGLSPEPWAGFVRAVGLTLLVAVFVSVLTRMRLIWRA